MIALLDVNLLIARADRSHQFHDKARAWLRNQNSLGIATCPLTENGFLRIFGNPSYPEGPGSVSNAAKDLAVLRSRPEHRFFSDSISILEATDWTAAKDLTGSQLTDLYLLALAVKHSAKFVTLDRRIDSSLVVGGAAALVVI